MADVLDDILDRKDYATQEWGEIRDAAAEDMKFVAGNPWTKDDEEVRAGRPTVAPEEMGQYFNQVINGLMANPRGMKFSPTGNGANDKGAEFYQNKARETEYRSNAPQHYITAATNAIQRSYGFVDLSTRYASPRSANQEIWIGGYPDPDLVWPDPDAISPDSSDAKWFFVDNLVEQKAHSKKHKLKPAHLADFASRHKNWVSGSKIREATYWAVTTHKRQLLLVQPPAPLVPQRQLVPVQQTQTPPIQVFEDEYDELRKAGATVIRPLREVDYPTVKNYFTNGMDILSETEWPGKYIPIVSCYGKILWVPEGGETKRKILSMTRFGRDPWKSMCYADSQILEILSQVPKANVVAAAGQLAGYENDWLEAPYKPKAFLYYKSKTAESGTERLPPPQRLDYLQGENLQAALQAREVFRQAIQSSMGSNFLPTQAQRRNEKSGKALDKMEQSAAQGTYHFVYSYEGMIRRVAEIFEDLVDKIYDYQGEVGVIKADGKADNTPINNPNDPKAVSTKGDYLVTVSSGPSSDSEREAADNFTETIVGNLQTIQAVAGPHAAAKMLGHSIRMRTELGAMGEQLADIVDPPTPDGKDGKPIPPEVQALQSQLKQATQQLQQAHQIIESKTAEKQAEAKGQFELETMKQDKNGVLQVTLLKMKLAADIEKARIAAAKQSADLAAEQAEERLALGLDSIDQAKDRQHDLLLAHVGIAGDAAQSAQDHGEALDAGAQAHDQSLEQGEQAQAGALAQQQQAADLQPPAEAGA